MSAPYTVRWGFAFEAASAPIAELPAAIHRCRDIRAQVQGRPPFVPAIFGDNIDLGCADGLDRDEREQIEEAGL